MSLRLSEQIEQIYTDERAHILATLIGILRDFDLAEEMMQEAFATALEAWRISGVPNNPRAWIVGAARHKAIDRLRRDSTFRRKFPELQRFAEQEGTSPVPLFSEETITDDRLRLIFTCCHPALATEAQVALTLRTLCGLSTDEIARAFLVSPQTMAQRLVRVQRKIAEAGIPYEVPPLTALPARIEAVLVAVYLIFTAGYTSTAGDALVRIDLCTEAIRLGRLLISLLPDASEPRALLALMLFHDSRRHARTDATGGIVLLDDQDRTLWNREAIQEGVDLLNAALRAGPRGSRYAIEASIAALHVTAENPQATDWPRIVSLYSELRRVAPSPVVELNEAVAIAMVEGPETGLRLLSALESSGRLKNYHLLPAAQARLLDNTGQWEQARNEPERRFLSNRLALAAARQS